MTELREHLATVERTFLGPGATIALLRQLVDDVENLQQVLELLGKPRVYAGGGGGGGGATHPGGGGATPPIIDWRTLAPKLRRLERLERSLRELRAELDCREAHGAESGGHLGYVLRSLDRMLEE